jgi:hypothetical protein
MRTLIAPAALLVFALGVPTANAQKDIPKSVLGSGGTESTSTNYGIRGTVGQTAIGTLAEGDHVKLVGYWYSPGTTVTGVPDPGDPVPNVYRLHQNYPNPFNPTTTIQFDIPQNSRVSLKVFDVAGRVVATLVNEDMEKGIHRVTVDASRLASGVYFYRIQAGRYQEIKKLVLLK